MEGVEPKLSLKTVEGALLSPEDPLFLLFDLGLEIHATVTSWNLIPTTQLYKDACRVDNIDINLQVDTQFDMCQATSSFVLEDCVLTGPELRPMFKALSQYHPLQHIRLSGNSLGDFEFKLLIDILPQFRRLRELDISCNNISSDMFLTMCQHVSQNGGFQKLEILDISFNPLGDNCIHALNLLMPCALALRSLRMSSISLTSFKAPPGFSLESIDELDVSYNAIGQEGARGFLGVLNADGVSSLNLAAVGKYAVKEVALFLSQCIPHHLAHLSLAYCNIDNADMLLLLEILRLCPQLRKLNLAGNKDISESAVKQLLQLPLIDLNLAGVKSEQAITTSIKDLYISTSGLGYSGPFSFCYNNLSSILSK